MIKVLRKKLTYNFVQRTFKHDLVKIDGRGTDVSFDITALDKQDAVDKITEHVIQDPVKVQKWILALKKNRNSVTLASLMKEIQHKDPLKYHFFRVMNNNLNSRNYRSDFVTYCESILDNEEMALDDRVNIIFSILEKVASIQNQLIEQDVVKFLSSLEENQKDVMASFEMDYLKIFGKYKLNVRKSFLVSISSKISRDRFPEFWRLILNCNISLQQLDATKELIPLSRFLINQSGEDNFDLVSGYDWSFLNKLEIAEKFGPAIDTFVNEKYFDFKFLELYPIRLMNSIIHKRSKLNEKSITNYTLQLIRSISTGTSVTYQHYETFLERLINLYFKKLEKSPNFGPLKQSLLTNLLTQLIRSSNMNMNSILLLLDKFQKFGTKLDVNKVLMNLVTSFRKRGQLNESYKLLKVFLTINTSNKNLQNAFFRYESIAMKDFLTEFYLILKSNYPQDLKYLLSYVIEISTNFKDIVGSNSSNVDYAKVLEYYKENPGIEHKRNIYSSFLLLNKLGILKLAYQNEIAEINFQNSLNFQFYQENLAKCEIVDSLRNLNLRNEHLSIIYSQVFDYLEDRGNLNNDTLVTLFKNYLDCFCEYNELAEQKEYRRHFFHSLQFQDVVLVQFLKRAANKLHDIALADRMLADFMERAKFENYSIELFEFIIYAYGKHIYNSKTSHASHYDRLVHWIQIMNEKFRYPFTFWNKFALILANMKMGKGKDLSAKLYGELVQNGENYDKLRHLSLINLANENGWPVPDYLKKFELNQKDDTVLLTQQDLDEFDNDDLSGAYTNFVEEDSSELLKLDALPVNDESDAQLLNKICIKLTKLAV